MENAEDNRKKVFKGVGVKVSNVNRTKVVISKSHGRNRIIADGGSYVERRKLRT